MSPSLPALSMDAPLLLAALLVAAAVAAGLGRGRHSGIGLTLAAMLIVAVLAARIAHVLLQIEHYRALPAAVFDVRDAGFNLWTGIGAALLIALWRGSRRPAQRMPLALGLVCGAFVWGGMLSAILMMNAAGLPKSPLFTLAGTRADLEQIAARRPLVVNLWATWCPPCRREMPLLADAQKRESGVRFVFVNQGEAEATVSAYLASAGLDLDYVLLDPGAKLAPEVGAGGLPTTLFYDSDRRLVDTHIGELSPGALAAKLKRLRPAAQTRP